MDNPGLSSAATSSLWIFGYGSLCWRPGIEYNRVVNGFVRGYARRFWQGNTTHRGTTTKPGRVATLIEDDQSMVWGCAYEVSGETALPYLANRECKLGGYMTKFTIFYPCEKDNGNQSPVAPFTALLYIATPKNDLWLGDAPLHDVANQIVEASGECGHNVEYLVRLADFMRVSIPEAVDEHLFTLEYLVKARIKDRNICIQSLMGNGRGVRAFDKNNNSRHNSPEREQQQQGAARADSFQYTARVPEKNLRCLNI